MTEDVQPGVFFEMDDETYHAIPALSASGIKNLLVSPTDFYVRSWMNPAREDEEDSDAKLIGRAYHTRILEGKAKFDSLYAPAFMAPEGCLRTVDELKDALESAGIVVKGKKKKDEFVQLANESLPEALIYDAELAKYERQHAGKTFLNRKILDRIEIAAAMIEKHPHLSRCFVGGMPEVTVVWEEGGVRFKSRFDYLKPKAIVDLKTFANLMHKPVDRAIYSAMANNKYHIQAAFYLGAVRKAQELVAAGLCDKPPPTEWTSEFLACEEHGFYFLFQQKGVAPLARGKKMPRGMVYGAGVAAIQDGIALYKKSLAKFGTDMWVDDAPIDDFYDEEFPQYITEI